MQIIRSIFFRALSQVPKLESLKETFDCFVISYIFTGACIPTAYRNSGNCKLDASPWRGATYKKDAMSQHSLSGYYFLCLGVLDTITFLSLSYSHKRMHIILLTA